MKLFPGKWNGFGGKVEKGENILQGAIREVKEECGLDLNPCDVVQLGLIHFEYENNPIHIEGHIFEVQNYSGEIIESEEMAPIKWFKITEIPYDKMWKDAAIWHPYIFQKQKFKSYFLYNNLGDEILMHKSTPVESLWK